MSISVPMDCTGSMRSKNNKGNAHVSPRTKDEGITPTQGSSYQVIEEGGPYLTKSRERTFSRAEPTMLWTGRRC